MPAEIALADLKGLTPALDPRTHGVPLTLSGKNFIFDVNGPKSDLGNEFLSGYPVHATDYVQGITEETRNGSISLTFVDDTIFEWSESKGDFEILYTHPSTSNEPYRWTSGYLNDFIYLCHPAVGVLAFNVLTRTVARLDDIPIPKPLAICVDNGRLIVIDERVFAWSEQSDGTAFDPALGGAGAQKIQDTTPGKVISVASYGGGTLTFCTGGIMRSSFTGGNEVYRHRNIDTDQQPINSFCLERISANRILLLDRRGFRTSDGNLPVAFAPLFGEYIKARLRSAYLLDAANIRFDWDEEREQVFLSFSASDVTPVYARSYVLYAPLDKWGSFDETHYGLFPIKIRSGERRGDRMAFLGEDKRIKVFTQRGFRELVSADSSLNLYRPQLELPSRFDEVNQCWIMASTLHLATVNETILPAMQPAAGVAGYYSYDGQDKAVSNNAGLDSLVRIGLFRLKNDTAVDQMAEIQDVTIGSTRSRDPEADAGTDWNLTGVDADWELGGDAVDYGDLTLDTINYGIRLIGTNDGVSAFNVETPTLTHWQEGQKYFTCTVTGVWHMIELEALVPGDYFHAKYVSIDGILAGRVL